MAGAVQVAFQIVDADDSYSHERTAGTCGASFRCAGNDLSGRAS